MSQKSFRRLVIAGNWKMYKTIEEAVNYVETLAPLIQKSQAAVYLAVPFTAIYPVSERVKELKAPLKIGAQNMNDANEGAFTGEIAARMLLDAGSDFVILGHSERRHLFHESDAFINKKVKRALSEKLPPIVCVGEKLEEREEGRFEEVLKTQILQSLKGLTGKALGSVILAYEPVWAIGTGKVAHPEDAAAAHQFCRSVVSEKWGEKAAEQLIILYGGSVKPENAADLLAQEGVDGLLVGGASLSPQTFSQIINSYQGKSV
ncbi:triose-phosphate isomerase [Chlamydiota bacterium]